MNLGSLHTEVCECQPTCMRRSVYMRSNPIRRVECPWVSFTMLGFHPRLQVLLSGMNSNAPDRSGTESVHSWIRLARSYCTFLMERGYLGKWQNNHKLHDLNSKAGTHSHFLGSPFARHQCRGQTQWSPWGCGAQTTDSLCSEAPGLPSDPRSFGLGLIFSHVLNSGIWNSLRVHEGLIFSVIFLYYVRKRECFLNASLSHLRWWLVSYLSVNAGKGCLPSLRSRKEQAFAK